MHNYILTCSTRTDIRYSRRVSPSYICKQYMIYHILLYYNMFVCYYARARVLTRWKQNDYNIILLYYYHHQTYIRSIRYSTGVEVCCASNEYYNVIIFFFFFWGGLHVFFFTYLICILGIHNIHAQTHVRRKKTHYYRRSR